MSKEKYYIPDAEEFHIGFEYEYFGKPGFTIDSDINDIDKSWIKTDDIYYYYDFCMRKEMYRVKYLDKEDIESFGFTEGITMSSLYHRFDLDEYCISTHKESGENYTKLTIYIYGGDVLYKGNIKNKSELKKMLEQLSIINNGE